MTSNRPICLKAVPSLPLSHIFIYRHKDILNKMEIIRLFCTVCTFWSINANGVTMNLFTTSQTVCVIVCIIVKIGDQFIHSLPIYMHTQINSKQIVAKKIELFTIVVFAKSILILAVEPAKYSVADFSKHSSDIMTVNIYKNLFHI